MSTKLKRVEDWLPLARQANWSVLKMAKLCGISPRTLQRYFMEAQGKTPKEWLAEQRQKEAIELLQDGTSVKEAASLLGYRHATSFAREFKKISGHRPNAFCSIPVPKGIQRRNVA